VHGEFLNVRGTKMSKRHGNFLTARDLREQGVDAAAVRLLFFRLTIANPSTSRTKRSTRRRKESGGWGSFING